MAAMYSAPIFKNKHVGCRNKVQLLKTVPRIDQSKRYIFVDISENKQVCIANQGVSNTKIMSV